MLKNQNNTKIIFHIDMNAFFCSVAANLDPTLRGKAFAIGRENSYRGVVSTCSYEARKYGIHSAMSLAEAYRRLPSLLVLSISYDHYVDYHHKFINLIKGYSSLIEVGSIDEVYVDMTEASKSTHPLVLAKEIQARLLKELGLPSSIGIAPTLFLAKMASDMKKPLGVTVLRKRDVKNILYPMSVSEIWGIGKKTYPRLIGNGIKTIADFMNLDNKEKIIALIGVNTYNYGYNHILGNSTNIVNPNRQAESISISTSNTYDVYKSSIEEVIYEVRRMAREIYSKMINDGYFTKTVVIQLRDENFQTKTRQISLDDYTDSFYEIMDTAIDIIEDFFEDGKRYRLIGIGLNNLKSKDDLAKEYNLFNLPDNISKEENLNSLMREMTKKFGDKALFWNKNKK